MGKTKVIIVDDEPRAIDLLKNYISKVDELEVNSTFHNPVQAFQYLNKEDVGLLFLDINMPHLSGLELYKNLKHLPKVIFTTAHPEHAIDGFDLNAVDYLLKPISFPRFLRACEKFKLMQSDQKNTHLAPADPIYIKNGNSTDKFYWRDIKYLEKDENYVIFHLQNGKRILSRQTLGNIEKGFPNYVVRIHRSFAVCLYNIKSVRSSVINFDNIELPIGRIYKNLFSQKFQDFKNLV